MDKIYDLIIVGAGPAGLAAGVYGARAKMKTLILEKGTIGGMASKTTEIVNYPGIPKTSGEKLGEVMSEHAENLGATIVRDSIKTVELNGEIKVLKSRRKEYKARSVIFATGTRPRVLGIPGEVDFKGSGVAYCATCDAEFFSNQEVVVVGSGDQAIEEGMFISKYASKVKVIVLHDEGVLDCNRLSAEEAFKNPKIEFIWNSTLDEIIGDESVERVKVKNLKTGIITDIPCKGVFFFVGMIPNTEFLEETELKLDKRGHIECDSLLNSSISGVFVAGDVREKYLKQVITAAADGAIAAVAAEKYLEEMNIYLNRIKDKNVAIGFWNSLDSDGLKYLSEKEKELRENNIDDFIYVDIRKNKHLAKFFNKENIDSPELVINK
ncbi:thioredoxin-disulfide reductase [Cetobacterium somerae]|uniref:thioredoxin-disulfide reductase n=2 Tax=Cetobacterium TaxID=180162 RepID=UPI001F06B3E6|nr:thioredoxin-disulfide reductase [Cetobacterium somerae]MCX3065877.1 thioredoxin-disulfide reductase [Cetobacterium somerae]UPO98018.1 thioredoxin-disulfide reductase [Cetobacterium somerae]